MEKRQAQIINERERRHKRLMKLIKNFKPSDEQTKILEKIKNNTYMQINIRFLKSEHNRYYRFPLRQTVSPDQQERKNPFHGKEPIIYDLRSQNQVLRKQVSSKLISLENTRRIKSLEQEKPEIQNTHLKRLRDFKERQLSYKKLRRNSMSGKKKVESFVRLPIIKEKEKIKTQSRNEESLGKVIGKKLITETAKTSKSRIEKYINLVGKERSKKKN